MTHLEALDSLLAHPHHWRFAELCESDDAEQRAGYRALVIRLATGGPAAPAPAPIPVDYGTPATPPGRPCCG